MAKRERLGKAIRSCSRRVSGAGKVRVAAAVRRLRLYNRPLRTSEAVAHYHAGPD
jgi:hypothetical protein